jgi:hypothetical protein
MKIVKFKNGKYAIRKWHFTGWAYLDKKEKENYWLFGDDHSQWYLFDNLIDALYRVEVYKGRKSTNPLKIIRKFKV